MGLGRAQMHAAHHGDWWLAKSEGGDGRAVWAGARPGSRAAPVPGPERRVRAIGPR